MGKSSAPPAPDYTQAAQATAAGNAKAAQAATEANRVNTYTPFGSLTYSQDPSNPNKWSSNVTLAPDQQALLDQQNKSSLGLAGLQNNALGQVDQSFSKPFDYSSVGDVQNKAYDAMTSRLDPQWQQNQSQLENQLANQGITQGSEAYNNSMRTFNQGKNDAYQQANLGAIQTAPQTLQMATALRDQPLNELNALRSGSQVTNPTFQNAPQQGQTAGPDMMGAANGQNNYNMGLYNSQVGQQNSLQNGLFSLGGAAIMASDRRLKSKIKHLGKFGKYDWYSYVKFGKPEIGVMAQEVAQINPSAVHVHPSGYLMVDYGAL